MILVHGMTVAERTLARLNQPERPRETRLFFQHALEGQFREIVEETLGRRTVSFVSGIDTEKDVSIEFFTLEPERSMRSEASPNLG